MAKRSGPGFDMYVSSARVKYCPPIGTPEEGAAESDFLDFDQNLRKSLGMKGSLQYTIQPKILGVTVQITYDSGALRGATTVGDGHEGEVVTANLKTILTVPMTLSRIGETRDFPEHLEVRGDVYMETAALESINQDRMGKGSAPFANAEQAAQDSLRQANPRVTARRPLNIFCHGVRDIGSFRPGTSYEMMIVLQSWGFRINRPHIRICDSPDEVLERCRAIRNKQKEFPFHLQGALLQVNRLDLKVRQASGPELPPPAFVYCF